MFNFLPHHKKSEPPQNLDEIKQVFFQYQGDTMSIWKCEPKIYEQCIAANIEEDVEIWRQQLISEHLLLLENISDGYWTTVNRLFALISNSKTLVKENIDKLLNCIDKNCDNLDKKQRILILEGFAGNTASQKDGGIYLIRKRTRLTRKMKQVIKKIADFHCDDSDSNPNDNGWGNVPERYNLTIAKIKSAYHRFWL